MAKREIYSAIVTRNVDDDLGTNLRGAIFFEAPSLFEGEYPVPAYPCFQFASNNNAGFFFVPKVGDEIEIEMYVDDKTDPYDTTDVELPEPRWRCMIYSDAADIDDNFKTNYPFRMGWKSNSGNIFFFDDTEGEELIRMAHKFGTRFDFDQFGNWVEFIVRDKIQEVFGNRDIEIEKDDIARILGNREVSISKNEIKTVKGSRTVTVETDSEHIVTGHHKLESRDYYEETVGEKRQNIVGSKESKVDGGYKRIVGGTVTETSISNANKICSANSSEMVAGTSESTYGTGRKETVALGNREIDLIAGNNVKNITAGNDQIAIAAGNIDHQTLAGSAKFGNLLGALDIDIDGSIVLGNPIIELGGLAVSILSDPVEDFITGKLKFGVPSITLK
jgi:hypothetical protein